MSDRPEIEMPYGSTKPYPHERDPHASDRKFLSWGKLATPRENKQWEDWPEFPRPDEIVAGESDSREAAGRTNDGGVNDSPAARAARSRLCDAVAQVLTNGQPPHFEDLEFANRILDVVLSSDMALSARGLRRIQVVGGEERECWVSGSPFPVQFPTTEDGAA